VDGACRSGRLAIPMGLIAPDAPAVSESPHGGDAGVIVRRLGERLSCVLPARPEE
jgi:hypothetical protein